MTYPWADDTGLMDTHCHDAFIAAKEMYGSGPKNPMVARAVALTCDLPGPVRQLAESPNPFLRGETR